MIRTKMKFIPGGIASVIGPSTRKLRSDGLLPISIYAHSGLSTSMSGL